MRFAEEHKATTCLARVSGWPQLDDGSVQDRDRSYGRTRPEGALANPHEQRQVPESRRDLRRLAVCLDRRAGVPRGSTGQPEGEEELTPLLGGCPVVSDQSAECLAVVRDCLLERQLFEHRLCRC